MAYDATSELGMLRQSVALSRSLYILFHPASLPEAPRIGQHVRIDGRPGVYVVLRLDMKRFAADLMLTTGNHEIEENIPYFAIEAIKQTFTTSEDKNVIEAREASTA
jgi:hypothetical protein